MGGLKIGRRRYDPVREYLILVGGPSNTFNGYYHTSSFPDGDVSVANIPPKSTAPSEIAQYIGVGRTHDIFWADFLYSAVKLVETGRLKPNPGDILTFMVFIEPYELRSSVDWDASPWNPANRTSTWVAGKKPYDSSVRAADQGSNTIPPSPDIPSGRAPVRPNVTYSTSENAINHEILMNKTIEQDQFSGYRRRPENQQEYLEYIMDIPRRIAGAPTWHAPGPLKLKDVLVKLLVMTNKQQLFDYVAKGEWSADRCRHPLEIESFDSGDKVILPGSGPGTGSWITYPLRTASDPSDWLKTPAVDRDRVKIRRFDYFGHSGGSPEAFFLKYGWTNPRNTDTGWEENNLPGAEYTVEIDEWEPHLSKSYFTSDAYAHLWGCNLALQMAEMLFKFVKTVEAADTSTDFEKVTADPDSMPVPADGNKWVVKKH